MDKLKENAEKGRMLYNMGEISREEAKSYIMPYIEAFNKKSSEIAKKYNQKPRKISFNSYVR